MCGKLAYAERVTAAVSVLSPLGDKRAEKRQKNGIINIVDQHGKRWIEHPRDIVPTVFLHDGFFVCHGIRSGAAAPAAVAGSHHRRGNVIEARGLEFHTAEVDAIEHMFLELYLALVLMTIDITALAPVAGQMGVILLAQAILMALFGIFVSFNLFGR